LLDLQVERAARFTERPLLVELSGGTARFSDDSISSSLTVVIEVLLPVMWASVVNP
jgi:hypothetical protein